MSEAVAQEERVVPAAPIAPSAADRFMRRLLRVDAVEVSRKTQHEAHRGFRLALVITGIRCLISYLLIPILVPIVGLAGIVSAPIGLALCVVAVINGIYSLRRFWVSNHRSRWLYTWFIAFVFLVLAVAMVSDIMRIVSAL